MTTVQPTPTSTEELTYCEVHPDRETALRCNKCGRPMCTHCEVLRPFGNMSSATLRFVLAGMLARTGEERADDANGIALAFGPGLAAESFRFRLLRKPA